MSLIDLVAAKAEKYTEVIQTKVTPSEADELDRFVDLCNSQGMKVTRSSVVRAFVESGLRAVADELGAKR